MRSPSPREDQRSVRETADLGVAMEPHAQVHRVVLGTAHRDGSTVQRRLLEVFCVRSSRGRKVGAREGSRRENQDHPLCPPVTWHFLTHLQTVGGSYIPKRALQAQPVRGLQRQRKRRRESQDKWIQPHVSEGRAPCVGGVRGDNNARGCTCLLLSG